MTSTLGLLFLLLTLKIEYPTEDCVLIASLSRSWSQISSLIFTNSLLSVSTPKSAEKPFPIT
uniref:Uncharacterized protein n=1 Tax=virus sp. ctLl75 TaxID=2828249 RepID=A0A8S5RAR3_9VIRU|nr:MAG TPA: hypothetical protein [virus sp. ctLl75]